MAPEQHSTMCPDMRHPEETKYEDTIQWPAHDKLIVTKILEKINNSIVFLKHLDVFTSEDWPEVFGKTYKGYKTTRRKSENP